MSACESEAIWKAGGKKVCLRHWEELQLLLEDKEYLLVLQDSVQER